MIGLILRAIGVLVCAGLWWWLSSTGHQKGGREGMLYIVTSFGALFGGAALLARPLAGLLGEWASTLFMPGDRHSGPQPMYSIPEGRLAANDYAGAVEAYAELAAAHPTEIVPHLRVMEIYLRVYQDADSARAVEVAALQSIKGKRNRERFANAARLIMAEAEQA